MVEMSRGGLRDPTGNDNQNLRSAVKQCLASSPRAIIIQNLHGLSRNGALPPAQINSLRVVAHCLGFPVHTNHVWGF